MHILVAGAGKIGAIVAQFLASSTEYSVMLVDKNTELFSIPQHPSSIQVKTCDLTDKTSALTFIKKNNIEAIVSCLPHSVTLTIAELAHQANIDYFDLTEDIHVSKAIAALAKNAKSAFVPHCGVAPGFINIVAHHLMQQFDRIEDAKLRCGALPQNADNALQYALTWSTDGLINEYCNPCLTIENKKITYFPPLEDLEDIQIDGLNFEAFNTSGGIGTLTDSYSDKVNNMNYKSIRYPGHCEKMKFLLTGLKLNGDRQTLKKILEHAIPTTHEDVVIVYVSITGIKKNELINEIYAQKFYPKKIAGINTTAIQAATASGACAVIDLVLRRKKNLHGFIRQETFSLQDILDNQFGNYFSQPKN